MPRFGVGVGTLLNTATVVVGSLVGLLVRERIPSELQGAVVPALGLVTVGMGLKLFLSSRNALIVAGAMALGAIVGTLLHIHGGLQAFGEWARATFGGHGESRFAEAVVTSSVLFCVGPMTLLGCLQEALENKIELIAVKSTLDGVASLFLVVALGPGVLVAAGVVFLVQGLLTLLGSRLAGLAQDEELLAETTAAGGPMLLAIGVGLLEIKSLPVANYLPALALAPAFVLVSRRFSTATPTDS